MTDTPPPDYTNISKMQEIKIRQNRIDRERIELESLNRQRIPIMEVRDLLARLRAAAKRELSALPSVAAQVDGLSDRQRQDLRLALDSFSRSFSTAMSEVDL